MQHRRRRPLLLLRLLALAFAVLAAQASWAQLQSGSLFGTITDDGGQPLPGVTVTLSGSGAPQVQVSDAQGRVRFAALSPGEYQLRAELEGFSPVDYPAVPVNIGRTAEVALTMNAAITDVITVTTESPLLDARRISTGATITKTELDRIPSARDPWAILQTTPGVLTDRINVGGNESGQQSNYVGPGSGGDQAVWSVDGVVITDMGALGSSPAYYDFDSFEEMQVTTGGSDASVATGGVVLNMVTKRGTNEFRGSARYLLGDDSLQSDNRFDDNELAERGSWNNNRPQPPFVAGNRIVSVEDYGFELGGPMVKDRAWFWGSYAKPQIDLLTVSDVSDFTELETMNLKLNGQISSSTSATLSALQSDKVKIGRDASPTRPQATTWNQSKFGDDPTTVKIEASQVFGASFYLTGMASRVNGGFQLIPQGGLDQVPYRDSGLVWHNSYVQAQIGRPQDQYKLDGSTYLGAGETSHELKFGVGYRSVESSSLTKWPSVGFQLGEPGEFFTLLARDANRGVETGYDQLYLQDTLVRGNLTANIGVRYEIQDGENLASSVGANPLFPDLLPAVSYNGGDAGFEWSTITPRLGLTYSIGAERATLVRASYSRFADQLGSGIAGFANPMYPNSYVYGYSTNDGSGGFRRDEFTPIGLDVPGGVSGNYNPVTRGLLVSSLIDPNLDAPQTDELLVSVEHSLLPEFVVGLNLTFRKYSDIIEYERLVFDGNAFDPANLSSTGRAHRRSDYALRTRTGTLPDGRNYVLPYYELRDGVSTRNGFLVQNGDREQDYQGASLTFNKRLANRWMMRGNFTFADWSWNSPDSENEDPTITLPNLVGAGIRDGDPVVQGSGTGSGSKGAVFINSEWSYSLNGLYQVAPDRAWGFNVGGSITGREGYPQIYFERFARATLADGAGLGTPVLIESEIDAQRFDDVHVLDLRLEKEFNVSDIGVTLSADVFNVTNESTVMQRNTRVKNNTGDYVTEILSPRIVRVGVKFSLN